MIMYIALEYNSITGQIMYFHSVFVYRKRLSHIVRTDETILNQLFI